jgi:hypothetical protein
MSFFRPSGNILPLALLMTFIVLLTAIGIGTVIFENAGRAQDTDQSVAAYYMADSGIERQLFEIRKHHQTIADAVAVSSTYPNGGRWFSSGVLNAVTEKTIVAIPENNFTTLDIFDPDQVNAGGGIDAISISWEGGGQLEIGYAEWAAGNPVLWPDDNAFISQLFFGSSATIAGLDPNHAYRIRIKALQTSANHVVIQGQLAGVPHAFPDQIILSAEGTYGKATQGITVTLPKTDILSGLYSYVVFSECQLIKGLNNVPLCP